VSDDPRERFLNDLKRELRRGPLTRRRAVREITAHLDDAVNELMATGMTETAALAEALRRLGDVGTITSAFHELRPQRGRRWGVRGLRSPAWVAVGAMSLVTALAAELPQTSGARAKTPVPAAVHFSHQARPIKHERHRRRS